MRIINRCVFGFIVASAAAAAGARDVLSSQQPIWSSKPDVNAFEKIENDRLEAAQRSIDSIVAVKGAKTIDNTLSNYDEALRQINAALYFSSLMEAVHPDAAFRDRATAMTRKVSVVQTALSLIAASIKRWRQSPSLMPMRPRNTMCGASCSNSGSPASTRTTRLASV